MICRGCGIWEENQRLRAEVERLRGEKAQLEIENGKLRRRLALHEKIQVPLTKKRRRAPARGAGPRFPGRPAGWRGSTRPRPKPEKIVVPEWDECERCGAPLPQPEVVEHHVVEEISNPAPKTVIDYLEFRGECPSCGVEVSRVHPDCPPSGRFGKNVYVQATLHKFLDRLPLEKGASALGRAGLGLSAPTQLELLWRTAKWLRPEYEQILLKVRNSRVVHTDQTGIKVDGANFWIWTFVTDSEILFAIRRRKSQKVLEEILGKDWRGVLVCDGARSHHTFARKSGAKVQRCWAHLLKEARNLAEKNEEAKALNRGLQGVFDRLRKALEKKPPPAGRARLLKNARRVLRRWMSNSYKKTVRKFAEKIRRGYPHWFTFVTESGVEPTNNRAERALRELVVQRKIIGTLRNEKGIFIYETLPTLLATWKQRGLDPQGELSRALTEAWQRIRESEGSRRPAA
jgi:transposase